MNLRPARDVQKDYTYKDSQFALKNALEAGSKMNSLDGVSSAHANVKNAERPEILALFAKAMPTSLMENV